MTLGNERFADFIASLPTASQLTGTEPMVVLQNGLSKQTAINAVGVPLNVKQFGVKGDGVTDDAPAIQALINNLPAAPTMSRGGHTVSGGVMGWILFPPGKYLINTAITVPAASIIRITGAGVSSWIPIDPVGQAYQGGTLIYSMDPTGAIWNFPTYSGGFSATGIELTDIEFRVFNPPSFQSTTALVLDGMITGIVENINILADLTTNASQNIAIGISLQPGALSARKIIMGINCYNFHTFGLIVNTTHILGENLDCGNIAGDTFSNCFQFQGDNDMFLAGLHCFSANYGIVVTNTSIVPLFVDDVHFESIVNPMLVSSTRGVYLGQVMLDTGVSFSGDLLNKCNIQEIASVDHPGLSYNYGSAKVLNGNSSVTVSHGLFQTPRLVTAEPQANVTSWVDTVGTTSFNINTSAAVGSDTSFFWYARL